MGSTEQRSLTTPTRCPPRISQRATVYDLNQRRSLYPRLRSTAKSQPSGNKHLVPRFSSAFLCTLLDDETPKIVPTCPYKHVEGQKRGKFEDKVWTAEKKEHVSERKFVEEGGPEELIIPGKTEEPPAQASTIKEEEVIS